MKQKRLESFFYEAGRHKEHILEARQELHLPIKDYEHLSKLEKFALNTLIFRFAKLQDLIGAKIMRAYLDYYEFPVGEMGFFEILKEIEKEGITDIDTWSRIREIRNDVAHEYPEELDEMLEKVILLVERSGELLNILDNLESKYREIERKRD